MSMRPQIERRSAQPYVGIGAHVTTEAELRQAADRGFPELFGWLAQNGARPSGPPFIRYLAFDEEGKPRDIEVAAPVGARLPAEGRIRADSLPEGRYVTYLHVGPYTHATDPDLAAAHAAVREWADGEGIALGGCIEQYRIGPVEESDFTKWETELAYPIADDFFRKRR
jgi:effector-binding domain-containing protein